ACDHCHRLDFHNANQNAKDAVEKAIRRIREQQGRAVIPCGHNGCQGAMKQVPYLSIHRCGMLSPIDIPFASRRVHDLVYRAESGSFLQSKFFDVDTGLVKDHSLQMNCPACNSRYNRASKQGRPVANPDTFHVHNIQYLCLKEETGKIVSRISSLLASGQARALASDLSEAVVSTPPGQNEPDAPASPQRELLDGAGSHSR